MGAPSHKFSVVSGCWDVPVGELRKCGCCWSGVKPWVVSNIPRFFWLYWYVAERKPILRISPTFGTCLVVAFFSFFVLHPFFFTMSTNSFRCETRNQKRATNWLVTSEPLVTGGCVLGVYYSLAPTDLRFFRGTVVSLVFRRYVRDGSCKFWLDS